MAKAQRRAMEIEKCELENAMKNKRTILDIATCLEKGIHIPDPKQFMWT